MLKLRILRGYHLFCWNIAVPFQNQPAWQWVIKRLAEVGPEEGKKGGGTVNWNANCIISSVNTDALNQSTSPWSPWMQLFQYSLQIKWQQITSVVSAWKPKLGGGKYKWILSKRPWLTGTVDRIAPHGTICVLYPSVHYLHFSIAWNLYSQWSKALLRPLKERHLTDKM